MAPTTPTSSQPTPGRKPKIIYQLDTPFTAVQWPQISPENQNTILELLCNLLSPIGQYRASHITPKGKRSKKRKRLEDKVRKESENNTVEDVPPPPEILGFFSVGLNSVARRLEAASSSSKPGTDAVPLEHSTVTGASESKQEEVQTKEQEEPSIGTRDGCEPAKDKPPYTPFSVVFVSGSAQPSVLHEHLPQLIATSSLAHPSKPATRLVQLPNGSEERLCAALGLPRVSFIGLHEDAPLAGSLVDLIRSCVSQIEIPWLEEVKKGKYLPVKINSIQSSAPIGKGPVGKTPVGKSAVIKKGRQE